MHFAQKLLLLATYLQSVDSRAARTLQEQGTPCHKIMSCLFEKANTMVASQDGLVTSLEGIQSLLLVAAYHNHSGDLTLAWMAIHRANGIAQVLGMHRGNSAPFSHRPHQGEQDAPCARTLSVLLVDMDLYLSMMLGLPQSTGAIQQAVMREVDRESNPPLEQLRHVHCFVASQILQRSYVASPLHQNVHELDQQVQKAAAAMPSQWWLVPNMDVANREGQSILHGTNRLMIQVVHYHLLLRLHLPGMLGSSSDQRHDVSKMTATHSARELLARYIALRRADRIPFHCCGTDLVAFVAVTVLCLAHIDSRNHDQASPFNFSFLTHSRLGDRAVMEHAIELVQEASQEDSQTITSKVARMMRHLLDVEASSVGGTIYNATSAKGQDQEYDGGTELKASHHGLHIYIPWFGTIKFERGAISTLPPSANHQNDLHQSQPTHSRLSTMEGISQMKGNGIPNHWDRGMAHCDAPAATAGAQQLPSFQSKVDAVLHSQPGPPAEFQSTFETNEPQTSLSQESPWILGTEEDWNAQGVDIALLNSIFSSNESADAWQAFISEQPEPVPPRNATHIA